MNIALWSSSRVFFSWGALKLLHIRYISSEKYIQLQESSGRIGCLRKYRYDQLIRRCKVCLSNTYNASNEGNFELVFQQFHILYTSLCVIMMGNKYISSSLSFCPIISCTSEITLHDVSCHRLVFNYKLFSCGPFKVCTKNHWTLCI